MLKKILKSLLIISLSLPTTALISSSCYHSNLLKMEKLANEEVGEKIWEYDAKVNKLYAPPVNESDVKFKNFSCKFVVGKLSKILNHYNEYLVFDILTVKNPIYEEKFKTIYTNSDNNVIALLMTKEIAKEIGLISEITEDWKTQISNFEVRKEHTAINAKKFDFDKKTKELCIGFAAYYIKTKEQTMCVTTSFMKITLDKSPQSKNFIDISWETNTENLSKNSGADVLLDLTLTKVIE
ncbi:hypothetical protein JN00_0557 [Metamycoplasma subdolum]|uniref:Lipoprotein n=1 Tax=Metamycoplasma subdolum TaxID=92407 RepID=A0A3L9ZYJ7_9BACT|nr:hypothetical protein [Metamycoplasma subdolum]RMA77447.1 hypothetical protein JN00_0557 [Metamycoplasma subdolum]WPB50324.1 hypothetical protein R9C05_01810 [Metamycoplasma subdolum]